MFSASRLVMIINYLKTGFRHLVRNRVTTIINVGGLALGMAIAILIGLWVNDEFTFDHHHTKHERIAQVYKGKAQKWLPYPLALELKENYHRLFKSIAITNPHYEHILSSGDEKTGSVGMFAEPALPAMLTLDMIEGSIDGLSDAHSILLSESAARLLFGNEPAIDKMVRVDNKLDVKVTGVYKDIPQNSSFQEVKFMIPWQLFVVDNPWMQTGAGWDNHFLFVYTELADGVTNEEVAPVIAEAAIKVIRDIDYMKQELQYDQTVWTMPMDRWHLHSTFDPATVGFSNGPVQFVYLVAAIGVFILLLACINFMNLATARSERRVREVGVRKAIGSLRSQLVGQFYCESFIVVILSLVIAVVIASLALPSFNELAGKAMTLPFANINFWIASISLTIITGVLAASYPALYLSSFRPAVVLKGRIQGGKVASLFRRLLVTIQFTVSISLVIATIVVYKQIVFTKNREVGYTREGLLMIRSFTGGAGRNIGASKFETLRNEMLKTGMAKEISYAGGKVTSAWSQGGGFTWEGKDPSYEPTIGTLHVDHRFGRTVGWKIVAGRDFEEGVASDSSAFVINEAAAKELGMMDPVGEVIHWKSKWHFMDKDFTVIGIVSNLMMKSPYDNVMPAVFYLQPFVSTVHVRLNDQVNPGEAVSKLETAFKKILPDQPFQYQFADDEYNRKFAYEERVGKLASVFAVLAISISCLGLFGMAVYMTERRTKEIGIRKVVGASVFGLWRMMSSEFVIIVAVSFLIAAPIAWFSLDKWMQNFVYRTELSWDVFAAAGIGSLLVTLLTVSFQLVKAASQNPVRSLKTE